MWRKLGLSVLYFFCVGMILTACSDATESGKEQDEATTKKEIVTEVWNENGEPVTVKVMYPWGEDAFEEHVVKVIEDEIPKNITLECICIPAQLEPLQEMNAQGTIPDIILAQWGIDPLYELEMFEPVDDYVEKYGVDISEFDESVIATYRAMDPEGKGQLIGLPTLVDTAGLFYNKEIFDIFGVPYPDPERPMTWEEVRELAAKMTGQRNGVDYRGFELGLGIKDASLPLKEFGINLTDPETGEVLITDSPEVRQYLEFIQQLYNIPGLYDPEAEDTDKFAEKTAAMTVSWPAYFRWGLGGVPEDIKMIDAAPIPVWEEGGKGPLNYSHPYVLNKYGENKDAGFQVILAIAKVYNRDPLTNPYSEFSETHENYPIYEGKNMKVFWNYDGALPPSRLSKWDEYVNLGEDLHKLSEGLDINEFLRILKEESEIKIEEEKLE
ncbi:ABC transporter substrate-binding protein [Lederbergia galactosidilytica]|uniref:Uncharacterized protein n=1 Tax=Lederbergia galactosidilytica TaxID=217031 RepID=A0A177ZHI7_9BACI|nr:extracellular solute-binding protein [Lederbergia galactosidilytica]MBP1916945.1 multiple sugar transport system substrate-binding protein [Lederbergia galactosidilytica]OAK67427.1 hypothetical protein ABB05_19995 [Lederbergia galactosidilytica]